MLERILIAGSGGQGIILAGRVLSAVAVERTPHLTFFPAYGAEVRGGVSNCHIVLSSSEIASPVCERFDTLILMNQASLDRFLPARARKSLVLVNDSLCRVPRAGRAVAAIPATRLADDLGNARAANFVMLGAYLAHKPVVPLKLLERAVREATGSRAPQLGELNVQALRTGWSCRGK